MLDILAVTQYIGVCTQPSTDGFVRYTAGILVDDRASAHKLGLGLLELPASTYAVVEVTGRFRGLFRQVLRALNVEFFPAHPQYRPLGGLEVYGRGDMQAADYTMELWVPLLEVPAST